MHLDSGSPVSIISAKTLHQLCPTNAPPLRPASFVLRDFQQNSIALKGVATFRVQFNGHTQNLDCREFPEVFDGKLELYKGQGHPTA